MSAESGHVVLVGDDGLGVRVLEELCELGVGVTAVAALEHSLFARAARAAQVRLLVDDPERPQTLRAAGVERARACALLANDDRSNLHVALDLKELAPGATLVMRLFNTSLAGPFRALVGDVEVLSPTELAAPAFVEAALRGSADFTLRVVDRRVTVQEVGVTDPRLRLALARAEGGEGREGELFPEDAARVVGIVDQGRTARDEEADARGALDMRLAARQAGLASTATGLYRASWLVARGLVGVMDRRLAVVAVLFALVIGVGAYVFDQGLGISPLDALYFTVTTVMSVGYGDINLFEADPALKLFGSAIMIVGGLVLALVFALLTDAIVGARLAQALGQGPLPKRDHVIVCGVGTTGGAVLEALAEAKVPCVAVERDEAKVDTALLRRLGVPLVVGDAASGATLDGLRLGAARAVMAMTADDLVNLQCALLCRARTRDVRLVLRMFDAELAARVERAVGAEVSRSVSALAAPAFVAAVLGHPATAVLPVGERMLQMVGLTAERATAVRALEDGCDARVLAVDEAAFPGVDVPVAAGAALVVVGTSRGVIELERRTRLKGSAAGAV